MGVVGLSKARPNTGAAHGACISSRGSGSLDSLTKLIFSAAPQQRQRRDPGLLHADVAFVPSGGGSDWRAFRGTRLMGSPSTSTAHGGS